MAGHLNASPRRRTFCPQQQAAPHDRACRQTELLGAVFVTLYLVCNDMHALGLFVNVSVGRTRARVRLLPLVGAAANSMHACISPQYRLALCPASALSLLPLSSTIQACLRCCRSSDGARDPARELELGHGWVGCAMRRVDRGVDELSRLSLVRGPTRVSLLQLVLSCHPLDDPRFRRDAPQPSRKP